MDYISYLKDKNKWFILLIIIVLVVLGCKNIFLSKDKVYSINEDSSDDQSNNIDVIIVHIAGAVKTPGVVEVENGQRLYEAIEKAGGTTGEADVDLINLAMVLQDGQKIIVPYKGESSDNHISDDKVNINTANIETLMGLPGIGETLAGNIIDYREKNGLFGTIEELKNVSKIGDVTYERLQDLIKAE